MTFKKVTQIIWMVLTVLFLAILAYRAYEESIIIHVSAEDIPIRINKVSGKLEAFDLKYNFEWLVIDKQTVAAAKAARQVPALPPGFVLEKEQPSSPKMTFEEFYFKEKAKVQKELEEAKKREAKK